MSKCDISVELDEPAREYAPGDEVTGTVTVRVDKDCDCDGLTVSQVWSTHGRGNRTSGGEVSETLFSGNWAAGTTSSYPFRFSVPNGPYSYHGHNLNIDWYIRARADIPWAIDPKGEADFLVGPSGEAEPSTYISKPAGHPGFLHKNAQISGVKNALSTGCLVVFLLPFVGMGLLSMILSVFGNGTTGAAVMGFFVGLLFTGFGGAMLYSVVRNHLAKIRLGTIDVELAPERAHAGDALTVRVEIDSAARDNLESISATLIGRERVVSGSGTNRSTHTFDFYKEPIDLDENAQADTSAADPSRLAFSARHVLPDDAAPSFYAANNELLWLVEVHIDLARWPDWVDESYVDVLPMAAPSGDFGDGPKAQDQHPADAPALEDGAVW
jgi:hypothetical protein